MQIQQQISRNWNRWLGATGVGVVLLSIALASLPRLGSSSPIPGLNASLTATGTLLLTITNGVTNQIYTIYSKAALSDFIPWSGSITGAVGTTNFVVDLFSPARFFKAEGGGDDDGDGVPSWQDADDHNGTIGILTITIETPPNGSNFN